MKLGLMKEKEEDEVAMPADAPPAADLAAANSEAGMPLTVPNLKSNVKLAPA